MAALPKPPAAAVKAFTPADVRETLRHPKAQPVWNGVVWSRLGRCDHAWAWWESCDTGALQPWILAEQGRVLRELGLHLDAEAHDAEGLALARDETDAAMLRIGLVADAVGRGDSRLCNQRLGVATHDVENLDDTPRAARQRLRLAWVDVEVCGLTHREPMTFNLPATVEDGIDFPPDYQHGSDFHRATGLVAAAAARNEPNLLEAAAEIAPPMLLWSVHLARAEAGVRGAVGQAKEAWKQIVPPPHYADEAMATATAKRLK